MTIHDLDRVLRQWAAFEPGLPRPYEVLAHAMATQPGPWDTARAVTVLHAAGLHTRRDDAWGLLRHLQQLAALKTPGPPPTTWAQDALFSPPPTTRSST